MSLENTINFEIRQLPRKSPSWSPRAAAEGEPGGRGGGGEPKPTSVPVNTIPITSLIPNTTAIPTPASITTPLATPTSSPSLTWPPIPPHNNTYSANMTYSTPVISPTQVGSIPRIPNYNTSVDSGAIIGGVCAALVGVAAVGFWVFRQRKLRSRTRFGASSNERFDNEKLHHQGFYQHNGSRSSSLTMIQNGGSEMNHRVDNHHHIINITTNRAPQSYYPEAPMTTGEMRSVPHTLPTDTAVYWPPPPGLTISDASLLPHNLATSPATETSKTLQRNPSRNPQDHRRQEQLEQALVLQRQQIQELRELQHRYMQENPLSSKLAPHAPTVEDRQIWQQTDQEQRQLWLRQTGGNSGPVVAAASGSSSSAIINVNTARDPQDWGPDDNHGGGGAEAEDVRNWEDGDELSPGVDGQQQNLRKYIAQMKEQYEEQFRKHQEELDRLRTEQETQLRILREQIKE